MKMMWKSFPINRTSTPIQQRTSFIIQGPKTSTPKLILKTKSFLCQENFNYRRKKMKNLKKKPFLKINSKKNSSFSNLLFQKKILKQKSLLRVWFI